MSAHRHIRDGAHLESDRDDHPFRTAPPPVLLLHVACALWPHQHACACTERSRRHARHGHCGRAKHHGRYLWKRTGQCGATVTAQSDNGFTRTAPVDASGRYAIGNLPVGTYTVTLQREGQAAETRKNIALRVGAGTDVSFGSSHASSGTATLGTITVTGNNISPVDVSATASRTVITAEQLQRLPLARSGEAIAVVAWRGAGQWLFRQRHFLRRRRRH